MSDHGSAADAAHGHAGHGGQGHGEHHDHTAHYLKIFGILIVLFLISVFGTFTPWFVVTLIVAFGVALLKAYLVVKHFMHINLERPVVWYSLTAALALMVLFFAAVSPDVLNHAGRNWTNVAAETEKDRREAAHAAGLDEHGGALPEPGAAGHGAAEPGAAGHGAAEPAEGHEPAPAGEGTPAAHP